MLITLKGSFEVSYFRSSSNSQSDSVNGQARPDLLRIDQHAIFVAKIIIWAILTTVFILQKYNSENGIKSLTA
jgi:hypothetical protein